MIRSDRFWAGRLLICLWIPSIFYTVGESRQYDKCTTGDGRQGVCVIKRYCREASQLELLPCERDEENHCCPIPTTQRSAPTLPPPVFDNPPEDDRYKPKPEVKRTNTDALREPGKDEQLNKTPEKEEIFRPGPYIPYMAIDYELPKKRPTTDDKAEDFNTEERKPYRYPGYPQYLYDIQRPRQTPQRRPITSPVDQDRRDPPIRQSGRDHVVRQPEREPPIREPSRDHGIRQPEGDTPIRQPNRDPPVRPPNRDPPVRHPNRDPPFPQPSRDPPVRHPNRDPPFPQPSRDPPAGQPTRDHVPSQSYPFYPPKDIIQSSRVTSPPRWNFYEKTPERKNRTTDDSSKFPITFPDTYEFSVPRPKVPACGVKPYDLFIAGGQESAEHEWPWMTAIFRRYPDSRPKTFLCGGSLINTKYVLTAAHCFVNNYVILPASSFVVRLGSHYLDSGEEYTVANLVIHHNHSGSDFFNDIALVRLASEVYTTDKIAPICLPPLDMIHQSLVGRLATVSGWGDTAFRTSGTRILQHVTVPVVSGEECFAAYSRVRGAAFLARGSDHVICAGLREGGKDACLGDSGGPLMIKTPDDRWIIVGIVSLGYKCAEPGYPGVYTRVTHYMSWINTNMKRH